MRRGSRVIAVALALAASAAVAAPASAATSTCPEPGASWTKQTPAQQGMDAAKLQDALDYGTTNLGFALRVYRRGCLVAQDRAAPLNDGTKYESWSMAKSVVALMFGRAMTLGLISPDDPVGSLVPEADAAHGRITMRQLLTMTSGLKWNGVRDYNIFTQSDRVRDALTLDPVKPPGTYFEYAQSPIALLAYAIGNAAGEDAGSFVQRELMDPLGIAAGSWSWTRDQAGHLQGFYGVNMRPDDFGRLGELMRRGGVWRGRRLLSTDFVTRAVTATPTNGCYGWLIWLNSAAPCIGPTITERGVEQGRDFPDLPADFYRFSGLFGQLVTVFPSEDLVVVRLGQDRGLLPTGGSDWEHDLYAKILGSITDQRVETPGDPPRLNDERTNADYGFQTALAEPDQYSKGVSADPLPPAGPARARASILALRKSRAGKKGVAVVRLACPGTATCDGTARFQGSRDKRSYSVAGGKATLLRFALKRSTRKRLAKAGSLALEAVATNADAGGGTTAKQQVTLRP
jgi:CubicO group peptidase (beta-lactamase class C family)